MTPQRIDFLGYFHRAKLAVTAEPLRPMTMMGSTSAQFSQQADGNQIRDVNRASLPSS